MPANLFSKDWYRIAELKPRLRQHVRIHAHRYRGERWYILEDRITGENRRLSPQAYWIIGLMNGQRTVDQLWSIAAEKLQEEMPTHEELLQLISSLYQANCLQMDASGDVGELFERDHEARQRKLLAKLKSPLSIQIPLVDPERFLEKTQHWVRFAFTPYFAVIAVGLIVFLAISAGLHWQVLTHGIADRVLAADNLLLLWLIYPVIKLLHELGHAYVVKRFGGEVHEMGIMLLVMMPMPYVDASASGTFASKWQRALVGAAGMIVELLIAALAMIVWVNAEPGMIKSIAYNILFVAGVSTLLVNGNPLLRFDGYYVFADFLEIPNLAQKANQVWAWVARRFLFGVASAEHPAGGKREFLWLLFYGAASLVYRIFLTISIVLFVAQKYFFIGVVLAVWSFVGVWLWPTIKTIRKAWEDSEIQSEGRNPNLVMSVMAAILVLLFAVIPFPLTTSIEGVVLFSDDQQVVAGENCFIETVVLPHGSLVHQGDVLVECHSPELNTQYNVIRQQLSEARSRRLGVWNDPVRLKLIDDEIRRLEDEQKELEKRLAHLKVRAGRDGWWWVEAPEDMPGRYLKRGEIVGYIADAHQADIRGMIPEKDIRLIRQNTQAVRVLGVATDWESRPVSAWHVFPSATQNIPSEVLTASGGGTVALDPSAPEPKTLQPYFWVDVLLAPKEPALVEQRVFIQFVHEPEPLVFRAFRLIRRTFLDYFDV